MVDKWAFPKNPAYLGKKLDLLMNGIGFRPLGEDEDPEEGTSILWRPETKGNWLLLHCNLWEEMTPDELRETARNLCEKLALETLVIGVSCEDSDRLIFSFTEDRHSMDWVAHHETGLAYDSDSAEIWDTYSYSMAPSSDQLKNLQDLFRKGFFTENEFLIPLGEILGFDGAEFSLPPEECAQREGFTSRNYVWDPEYCKERDHTPKRVPEFVEGNNSIGYGSLVDRPFSVFVQNHGGAGKGVGLVISGPFVEKDLLWIDLPGIRLRNGWDDGRGLAAKTEKIHLDNGEPAYRILFPEFVFPEGYPDSGPFYAPKGLSRSQAGHRNFKKAIEISFTLRGDPSCQKDAIVSIFPMERPDNLFQFWIDDNYGYPWPLSWGKPGENNEFSLLVKKIHNNPLDL